jgi:hypothetical protein
MFFDSLGLAELNINYSVNGNSHQLHNPNVSGQSLINILSGLPNNSISNISLFNHGGNDSMTLANGNIITTDLNGRIAIMDNTGNTLGYFDDLLEDRLVDGGSIELRGCNTAAEDYNLSRQLSINLPNSMVTGYTAYTPHFGAYLTGGYGISIGPSATYQNGNVINTSHMWINTGTIPDF